ncbi:MAG: carboxypeptidase regulatory-like domain-containing protein [Acidobacteria bacterium]|nr:carboxypeptidase regulatory-like domain-containing protein [Acidobacteriota bacterium]
MRITAVFLLLAPVLVQGQGSGTIEGTVVGALTQAPIPGVTVIVQSSDAAGKSGKRSTTTDASGTFRIEGVDDGEYVASFEHAGFAPFGRDDPSGKPFRVSGSSPVRLRAELVSLAKLSGRVLAGDQPAASATVELVRSGVMAASARADDQGIFQLESIVPGRYLLRARPETVQKGVADTKSQDEGEPRESSPQGGELADEKLAGEELPDEATDWMPTYYPGVVDRLTAATLVIRPGAELYGHDFSLRAAPVFPLRGTVHTPDALPVPGATVTLSDAEGRGMSPQRTKTNQDGVFEFPRVPEGEWRLRAQQRPVNITWSGTASVFINPGEPAAPQLWISAPFDVEGFVDYDDPPNSSRTHNVTALYLVPADPLSEQYHGFHDKRGRFLLRSVQPGRYRIRPTGAVPGYYLAGAFLGGSDVLNQAVDLYSRAEPIRVLYKPNGGRVQGQVENGQGSLVALIPQDEGLRHTQFIHTTTPGHRGGFELSGLRPGDYYAFAFERAAHFEPDLLEDVTFIRNLVSQAVSVRVNDNSASSVELKITPWPEY